MENFSTADLVIFGVAAAALTWLGWTVLTKKTKGKNPFNSGTPVPGDETGPTNPTGNVKPKTDGE